MSAVSNGIIWETDGPLAVWSVGTVKNLALDPDPIKMWSRLRGGLAQLPQQSQLLGVTAPIDSHALTARLTGGGAAARRRLVAESEGRWERRVYLVVVLDDSPGRAALRRVVSRFGAKPEEQTWEWALRRRDNLTAKLADLRLKPAADPEIAWLTNRLGDPGLTVREASRARSFDLELREGITSLSGPRRWVSAEGPVGRVFYSAAVIAEMPDWTYPGGGEWFLSCDMLPFRVDWSVRIRSLSNREGRSKFERRQAELSYQWERERGGETSDGGHSASLDVDFGDSTSKSLVVARESADDALVALGENSKVPLLEPTISLVVSGVDPEECNQRMSVLEGLFEGSGIILRRPLGVQSELLAGLTPSPSTPATLSGWSQPMLPGSLATGLPVTASPVGDRTGGFLGWMRIAGSVPARGSVDDPTEVFIDDPTTELADVDDSADDRPWTCQPAFFDVSAGPRNNQSSCTGFVGKPGGGKSMTAKTAAQHVIDDGGRVVVYDPTEKREWSKWASAVTDNPTIISLDGTNPHNLDPLTVFEAVADKETYGHGLASILTGVAGTGSEAMLIRQSIQEIIGTGGGFADLPDAIRRTGHSSAEELAAKVASVIDTPLGRSLLTGKGESPTSNSDVVVFEISGLSLPPEDQLKTDFGRRQLLPEQIMSQAALYLIAAVARELTMRDDRFSLAILEEAYKVVKTSPQGRELVLTWVGDSRKHNASVFVIAQTVEHLPQDLLDLLPNRFVFSHDEDATRALKWLFGKLRDDEDDDDDNPLWRALLAKEKELVEEELISGECLFRHSGVKGVIRTALPVAELIDAFDTNPVRRVAG